jgi:hypothetical protein
MDARQSVDIIDDISPAGACGERVGGEQSMAGTKSVDPFADLTLAAQIEDRDEIARLILGRLDSTEQGQERLSAYDGPLPTLNATGSFADAFLSWFGKAAWQHTDHAFGFLAPGGDALIEVGQVEPDAALLDKPLTITLSRLRAFDYPGSGELQVLLQFTANHFVEERQEPTQFAQTYAVREGQAAGVTGYPIFLSVRPGPNGLGFRVGTVLAENEGDRDLIAFLESDVFRQGLDLAGKFNPALKMVGEFASGIFSGVARRNKNRGVQRFDLGLGFSQVQGNARLREGTYFAVQVPRRAEFHWDEWRFDAATGVVVRRHTSADGGGAPIEIPYNYLAFTVSRS